MPKAKGKTPCVVEDTESEDDTGSTESEESEDTSSSSPEDEVDSDTKEDAHGPPSHSDALTEFYRNKKRVDSKEVTCVLHNKTLGMYFKTM